MKFFLGPRHKWQKILKGLPAGGRDQTLLITPGNPDSSGRI